MLQMAVLRKPAAIYVDATLAMLVEGNLPGASCAYDWYYKGAGLQQLAAMLPKYRTLPVTGIIKALVARQCAALAAVLIAGALIPLPAAA
jgi:hypothetical protein